ncbi:MAG: 23S rRNA (adenine(2503)-C(2))-methyltransferase RlmN [Chitinophagaceae bacterium]|nr:23S rRNA (adenine(2503)-C(2))-methyltransferase RlmN [Chitinophagaceae bacterium]MBL0255348.1 23S rRNA (adenine(2503)-C(2))-methyltransferase RlmN [Chitinophagaceae bacterium]
MDYPKNIRELGLDQLKEYFISIGDKKFRAMQTYEWLWKKNARKFSEMTNLSLDLRQKLEADFELNSISTDLVQNSADGTVKMRFRTFDNHLLEGVIIPTEKRFTACVSSQIGCSLSCSFCATGRMERKRNLSFEEIYDQVAILNEQSIKSFGSGLTNIVFMGMGEPLLNYKDVLKAIERITSTDSFGMSPKRITVSTAGVAKMIKKLGDDGVRFNLALSLHASNDIKRNEIMEINETNNIKSLTEALNYFYAKTKSAITLEYVLLNGVNDSLQDAKELAEIYKRIPVHTINVIEYNTVDGIAFTKSDENNTEAFVKYLSGRKVNVHIRRSRGKDIDAACGQLANK